MLLTMFTAMLALDAGPPVLHDGDFEYTQAERAECGRFLSFIDMAPGDKEIARDYRSQFRSCVRSRRRSQEVVAAAEADIDARHRREEEAKAAMRARDREAQSIAQAAAKAVEDPTIAQPILSALLCNYAADRTSLLGQIAKDQKYSKIGGAVNLRRRAELQDDLADTDDGIKYLRASLRAIKRPPMSCKNGDVSMVAACLSGDPDDHTEECATPKGRLLIEAGRILTP